MKIRCSLLFFTLIFVFQIHAQVSFYINDAQEVSITKETKRKYIKAFLKAHKAKAIEFNPNPDSNYPLRIKTKKGNWALFNIENRLIIPKSARQYSFQFPTKHQEENRFTWATQKNKIYWVDLYHEKVETKMSFDEVKLTTKTEIDRFTQEKVEEIDKIAVRKEQKWGLIEPSYESDEAFYLSRNFLYNSPEEVPNPREFPIYQLQMIEQVRKDYNADLIKAVDDFGYYLKIRNKRSQRWGLVVGEGQAFNEIPMQYDDIIHHRNPETFEVHKDGKVGYYNSQFELIKNPIYEDFHFMHLDYTRGCALQKDGFWQLFNAFDGSLMVDGKAKTLDELQELWLNGR
ncbi:hypothetical protein [Flavobacteriaceae bacterium 14752]|uniref:hypothetical protein n=1 Tax=Mesohalobacter salilacus TaxID=2491711 RepID=UPI000F6440EC|nr:hypothetical protein EIG84_01815 [Flavobacteriaceae bacterium 14752]